MRIGLNNLNLGTGRRYGSGSDTAPASDIFSGANNFLKMLSQIPPGGGPSQAGPASLAFLRNAGSDGSNTMTEDKIRQNPELLSGKGIDGIDIEGMDLETDQNGKLTEESKRKVNELIGLLSDKLGVEVCADAYKASDGSIKLHLTAGDRDSVTHRPPQGTVYSAHTHPNGSSTPSNADFQAEIAGAEDAVVPCDGIPGNEDGSNYNIFA